MSALISEARVNTVPFTPSPEAIEEFKVQAGTYSAEYGTHAGAQLAIALKSGTNAFHGDAFEFLRNDKLDAQDYFQNYFNPPGSTPTPKNLLRQNQYGFLLTGPILIPKIYSGKNRTFFMFEKSMVRPSLQRALPAMLCPAPRIEISSLCRRANAIAGGTSSASAHCTIIAGR